MGAATIPAAAPCPPGYAALSHWVRPGRLRGARGEGRTVLEDEGLMIRALLKPGQTGRLPPDAFTNLGGSTRDEGSG